MAMSEPVQTDDRFKDIDPEKVVSILFDLELMYPDLLGLMTTADRITLVAAVMMLDRSS
jgi:hypothetical protein